LPAPSTSLPAQTFSVCVVVFEVVFLRMRLDSYLIDEEPFLQPC
jgi:hypothetical protein